MAGTKRVYAPKKSQVSQKKANYVNTYTKRLFTQKPLYPLGRQFKTSMRYVESIVLNSGVTTSHYSWKANSLFDPNDTGVGHQPLGFDQIIPFWGKYQVTSAAIRVNFFNMDTAQRTVYAGIKVSDINIPTFDARTDIERGHTKYQMLTNINGTKNHCQLTHYVDIGKFLGITDVNDDERLKGTASTSPSEGVYFHVFSEPTRTGAPEECVITVQIDYNCVFSEPADIPSS